MLASRTIILTFEVMQTKNGLDGVNSSCMLFRNNTSSCALCIQKAFSDRFCPKKLLEYSQSPQKPFNSQSNMPWHPAGPEFHTRILLCPPAQLQAALRHTDQPTYRQWQEKVGLIPLSQRPPVALWYAYQARSFHLAPVFRIQRILSNSNRSSALGQPPFAGEAPLG